MTHFAPYRHLKRAIAAAMLVTLAGALSGCGSFNTPSFEPGDLFDFLDTKKKLPGDRRAVFPEGVPGLEQGVPKDLYKGAQASTANQQPIEPPPPAAAEPPPRQKRTASRPQRQPAAQPAPEPDAATAADDEGVAAAPPAPPPPRRAAQRKAFEQQPSAFPAPLPSGSFAR